MAHVYVLGTHSSHDGSACLLKDGTIAVAIEKERLTRIKHDGGNDNAAVRYCLNAEGITIDDVELVVQNSNFDMFQRRSAHERGAEPRIVDGARRVVTISHHLAHAFSTIGTAPFPEMAALVIDGCGNCFADAMDKEGAMLAERPATADLQQIFFEKDSYYRYRGGMLHTVYKDFSPLRPMQRYCMYPTMTMHSIGGAYAGVSAYIFRGLDDPGKLMGLAPYGRPHRYPHQMFTLRDGRVFLNYDWMLDFDRPALSFEQFKDNFQYYADIAWWAQREIEAAILYVAQARYELYAAEFLGYSGGVALNAVANRRLRMETRFKDIYFQPAAGDNGLSLGCAYYGWLEVLEGERRRHDGRSNFGIRYARSQIETSLHALTPRIRYEEHEDIVERVADLLVAGKIIGWFQGGSEFGPRALGHRSILALPTGPDVRDFINAHIKFREDFRPFAPSVLAEDANQYFQQEYDSPYMILVAPTLPESRGRIPAVVHRDGSARVQTVHEHISPRYYSLLEAVKRRCGSSVLLNTSLNRRGTPMVESPSDALDLLLSTALDAMALESWLVFKQPAPTASSPGSPAVESLFAKVCAKVAQQAPSRDGLGTIRFDVTNIQETWTLYLSESPEYRQGGSEAVEQTVRITASALRKVIEDPSRIPDLVRSGEMELRHSLDKQNLTAFARKVGYLLHLAR